MCRNIRPLFNLDPTASDTEIREAARQYVRKLSGFAAPSRTNEAAFERAIDEVARATRTLLATLVTSTPPRDRAVLAARAAAQSQARFPPRTPR